MPGRQSSTMPRRRLTLKIVIGRRHPFSTDAAIIGWSRYSSLDLEQAFESMAPAGRQPSNNEDTKGLRDRFWECVRTSRFHLFSTVFSKEGLMRSNPKAASALLFLLCMSCDGAASARLALVDAHAKYPEGPLWDHGHLLYVEYVGSDIREIDKGRAKIYWHKDHCGPSALIRFDGDHLLVACYDGNYLAELDSRGALVRTISHDSAGKSFVGPNDFAADGRGGVYFSASGVYNVDAPITGAIYHLSADGREMHEVANHIHYPNGLTLSRSGRHLLVAEMLAARIISFPLRANGTLGPRQVWARLRDLAPPTPNEDAYNGPDGFKVGPDGNYYIAQNGSGRVLVVSKSRKLVRIIKVPTPYVTNIGFGPIGTNSVYITGAFAQWKPPYPGAVYRWTPN